MPKTVAIHQPNFFPWLGYFDKIARADIFLFFDDVQFPKKGGVWSNRVKLLISGEARWVTAAIDRSYHGTRQIREMNFLDKNPWRTKMLKSIEANYRRHPFYVETMSVIEPLILNSEANIAEYNINAVLQICQNLGINTAKIQRSSEFSANGHSNELLCSLTNLSGGDTYMCGGGAEGYQEDEFFEKRGIELIYQNFQHPAYPQHNSNEFISGLSIIDTLMNLGVEQTRNLFN